MTSREPKPVSEADLHGFADGQLSPQRRTRVEDHLLNAPEDRARLKDYQRINNELEALYSPVLEEPIPDKLRHLAATRGTGVYGMRMAAAIGGLAVGLTAGLLAGWIYFGGAGPGGQMAADGMARRAIVAHRVFSADVRHPVEVRRDQKDHLVRWLSNRLGGKIKAPDLSALGFELIGGRLLAGADAPAAQLMFEAPGGERVTLYVKTGETQNQVTAFRWQATPARGSAGAVNTIYWIDGPFGYAVSGSLARPQLENLAHLVHEQLAD